MLNVKQISDKFNVSRVSIYKHFKQLPDKIKNDNSKMIDGKRYFNKHLIKLIINSMDKNRIHKSSKVNNKADFRLSVKILQKSNDQKQARINKLDKELADSRKRFDKQQNIFDHEQILRDNADKERKNEIDNYKRQLSNLHHQLKITDKKQSKVKPRHHVKHNFWWHLVHKW